MPGFWQLEVHAITVQEKAVQVGSGAAALSVTGDMFGGPAKNVYSIFRLTPPSIGFAQLSAVEAAPGAIIFDSPIVAVSPPGTSISAAHSSNTRTSKSSFSAASSVAATQSSGISPPITAARKAKSNTGPIVGEDYITVFHSSFAETSRSEDAISSKPRSATRNEYPTVAETANIMAETAREPPLIPQYYSAPAAPDAPQALADVAAVRVRRGPTDLGMRELREEMRRFAAERGLSTAPPSYKTG
ncbi:hypothetical protein B0H19DRAFT_1061588 [Mycena capillaripes]|nr:hypothetical protein B0H19DRAFT_1061588 [Mycena capillaripes]